jgi:lysophospholipase L1-like esterase
VTAAVAMAACSGNPAGPQIGPPSIACSALVTAASPTGAPVAVRYDPPLAIGEAPVTATCTPASNSLFSVGTTNVSCTARDSHDRTASCSFPVTVTTPPRLTATKFLGFGDSMTAGELNTQTCPGQTFTDAFGTLRIRYDPKIFDPTRSYPPKLQVLLTQRYAAQSFTVFNDGLSGERTEDGAKRFPGDLAAQNPQVAIIWEGANNFLGGNDLTSSTPQTVEGLRSMIRTARDRGVTPFVANQLPKRPGSCRGGPNADQVPSINAQIKAMVEAEGFGSFYVDLYAAFGGVASTTLISFDGLHPTEAGNDLVAQTFMGAIRARLEQTPTPTLQDDGPSAPLVRRSTKTR